MAIVRSQKLDGIAFQFSEEPNCALQHLSVSACGEVNGIAGAQAVNTSVEIMDVSYCSITNAGTIEIANALAVNTSLKSLTMDSNHFVTAADSSTD